MRAELNQEASKWVTPAAVFDLNSSSGSGGIVTAGAAGGGQRDTNAAVEAILPPPRGPYDLPPDLMALVVDFAAGGGIRMDRGRS